jgi:hypothetical protein
MAKAQEQKRPNPCGLLVGKIQNIAGVCAGITLIIAGSLAFRGKFKLSTYQAFLVAVYFIFAGAATISVEMKDWPFVEKWMPFLSTFWGRGAWYIFWSILIASTRSVGTGWFYQVAGACIFMLGLFILFVVPCVVPDYNRLGMTFLCDSRTEREGALTGPARDAELTDCRKRAEKAEGALDAAEARASKAEEKLKKLETDMPYLKGALESKERRASAAEKALGDAADNA